MLSRTLPRILPQRTLSCAESVIFLSTAKAVMLPPRRISSPGHFNRALQGCLPKRALSTPAPHTTHSDLPIDQYHVLADATMTSLLEQLEDLLDGIGNGSYEVDYHSGVLTLNLGSDGTYVINKQPPNKQIWFSSPVSGPKRYDYMPSTDDWRYSRDGEEMGTILGQELTRALGREVKMELERVSKTVQ